MVIAPLPWLLVLLKLTVTLPFTGTDRLKVPPSLAVLLCAPIEKCAVGPDKKLRATVPVAVELSPLVSVTVNVIVLLAVPKLKLQLDELEQIEEPLLFQVYVVIAALP